MNLFTWANRHNISPQALKELTEIFGLDPSTEGDGLSEAAVQVRVRLEASRIGARLWRNNTGATPASESVKCPHCSWGFALKRVPVRYGLCNESSQMNAVIKGSDLIGIKPVLITQDMVGLTIGQFMAREVKKGGWHYTGTDREVAQLKFIEIVNALGGDAKFTTGEV